MKLQNDYEKPIKVDGLSCSNVNMFSERNYEVRFDFALAMINLASSTL